MSSLFQLRDVGVRFGPRAVLAGVTLAVPRGQTVCLIGESGCGKSVTLKLLVGLLAATDGRVTFDGADVAAMTPRQLTALRRRVGLLFQQAALFDSLTVADNIAFGPRTAGLTDPNALRQVVRDRLAEVGLGAEVADRMPADLSGGMRKRVGLARALATDPEVVLYDEPTTGLDPVMTGVINDLIVAVRTRRPVTGVVVTHEMRTVRAVADRVVMLEPLARLRPGEPQVIYDGPPDGLATCDDGRVRGFVAGGPR